MASLHPRSVAKPAPPGGGRRERNKAQKLQRIRLAARELFLEKGYDDATTRAIARRAGVGLGTLFTYAANKRDLLFLIFNDELERVAATAFAATPADLPFVDRLIEIFRHFYIFFGQQPRLARFILRELTFYITGPEAQRFQGHRERILAQLAAVATAARAQGRITAGEPSALIGRAIFAIYSAEIRRWLDNDALAPDVAVGLKALRRLLELLASGLRSPRRA